MCTHTYDAQQEGSTFTSFSHLRTNEKKNTNKIKWHDTREEKKKCEKRKV